MPDSGVTKALTSARPTLKVNGQATPKLSRHLLSAMVEETSEGIFRCEMTYRNWGPTGSGDGYLYFDRSVLDFGSEIELTMGSGEATGVVFTGRIMGLEGRFPLGRPPELTILADDPLQDLRMTRRTRSFGTGTDTVTDADVFDQVISPHGLTAAIDVQGPANYKVLAQVNQSDLAFLRERARLIDAEVWVDDKTLHIQSRSKRTAGEVQLTYRQRLREFSVLADLSQQRTSVAVTGWDVATKKALSSLADSAGISSEAKGLQTGSDILSSALGTRTEQLVHTIPMSDDEAKAVAEATFNRAARRFVTGVGLSEGDARIKVGTSVDLLGLGLLFSGKHYVVEVRHLYDEAQGFRTQFRVERPGVGM
jgi:phage protein D